MSLAEAGTESASKSGTVRPVSFMPLSLVAAGCVGIVFALWALAPALGFVPILIQAVIASCAVTGMTIAAALVAPVPGWKSLVPTVLAGGGLLVAVVLLGEGLHMAVAAVAVTGALLTVGTAIGGAVGGRIEHPGHLLVVVVLSLLVDSFSVFHTAGPTAAIVARPAVIAVLALPWPIFGAADFVPVLGVGDVVFAALYMSTARQFGLPRWRTAAALAVGLLATMAAVMLSGLPLPALVGMGIAVLIVHPEARRLPKKDRRKALIGMGGIALVWLLLWLRN